MGNQPSQVTGQGQQPHQSQPQPTQQAKRKSPAAGSSTQSTKRKTNVPTRPPLHTQTQPQTRQIHVQQIESIPTPTSINPYEFFQVTETSTPEDLKASYRQIVLKYHPDRGGDPQIFALIQHYYKELEEELRKKNTKIYDRPVVPQTYDDQMNRGQQNIHLDADPKKFDVNRFNQVFSQVQNDIQRDIGDPNLRGYGDFMDNTQRRSADEPIAQGGEKFRSFDNGDDGSGANEQKDVMVYREPEILYSGQGLSFIELGQNSINDFSGYDSRGNVRFMDYKKAMTNPQEIRAAPRPEYRNVDEYKRARENITPLTEEEKQQQLYKKQQEQQQEEERQRKLTENDHIIQRHFQNVNHRFIR